MYENPGFPFPPVGSSRQGDCSLGKMQAEKVYLFAALLICGNDTGRLLSGIGVSVKKNPEWHLVYCDEDISYCPVTDFIQSVHPKHQVKIMRFLSLLEEMGPNLPRPYADFLTDGIHELRIKLSGDQIRMLYFFCYRKYIVLYYAFIKNTDRVPEKFIHKVSLYRNDFLRRIDPLSLERQLDAIF